MEFSKALAQAMAASGMRDEHVAIATGLSFSGIQAIRMGRTPNPRRSTMESLKRVVPGLEDLLKQTAAA